MKQLFLLLFVPFFLLAQPRHPFPQEQDFPGCIKPTTVSQSQMNQSVIDRYTSYKRQYLKKYQDSLYYIEASGNGNGGDQSLTISEAHGYGMIILALMAGYDKDAQKEFDGMFYFAKAHPSRINPHLMSWLAGNISARTAATDGDFDNAYALILADKQWGSDGAVNYLAEARTIINEGILKSEMSSSTKRILLGDWSSRQNSTRSSDWMTGHLHAFEAATGNPFWGDAADTVYSLIDQLTASHAPSTGLMPDFINGSTPYPDATGGGTGEKNAEHYYNNAARYPWRIALDYAHNGIPEAKAATLKVSQWLRDKSNNGSIKITPGYRLDGSALNDWREDLVYLAPFAAGTITDASNQQLLNTLWGKISGEDGDSPYRHALNLLSMLLITGNWWSPMEPTELTDIHISATTVVAQQPSGTFIARVTPQGGSAPIHYTLISPNSSFVLRGDSLFSSRSFKETEGTISCTIKAQDAQNSVTKEFHFTVEEQGHNLLSKVDWSVTIDRHGSSVDTGSSLLGDSTVEVTFHIALENSGAGVWTSGTLKTDTFEKSLSTSRFITLEYHSTNSFEVVLPLASISDYAYYTTELPMSKEWTRVTLPLDTKTFKQPTWGKSVPFDLSQVSEVQFKTNFDGASGTKKIRFIDVENIRGSSATPIAPVGVQNKQAGIMIQRLTRHSLSLTIPQKGLYTVSLFNASGKRISQVQNSLQGGANVVSLKGLHLSRGVVFVTISGAGTVASFKTMIR